MRYLVFILMTAILCVGCGDKTRRYTNVPGLFVTGTVYYEKANVNVGSRTLSSFSTNTYITYAKVQLIDFDDNIVAEGATNADGEYKVDIPAEFQFSQLKVRVLTESSEDKTPFAVMKHSFSREVYAVESEPFIGKTVALTITATRSSGLAGAFNIFQQTMRGFKFVQEKAEPNSQFPELDIHWEKDQDGRGCTCFIKGVFSNLINIRGLSDPEEFDDSVVLHELGHYMHDAFGDSDSPGGPHNISCSVNQVIDPRLAWSEGWASGFAQMVLKDSRYIDTNIGGGFLLDLEYPCTVQQGPYSEYVISSMYWDLYDGNKNGAPTRDGDTINLTFKQIWDALKATRGSSTDLGDYYTALRASGAVTSEQWNQNFRQLGIDETALLSIVP